MILEFLKAALHIHELKRSRLTLQDVDRDLRFSGRDPSLSFTGPEVCPRSRARPGLELTRGDGGGK